VCRGTGEVQWYNGYRSSTGVHEQYRYTGLVQDYRGPAVLQVYRSSTVVVQGYRCRVSGVVKFYSSSTMLQGYSSTGVGQDYWGIVVAHVTRIIQLWKGTVVVQVYYRCSSSTGVQG
jgi:hypothetical protein